jgi:hypothetical protein
MPTDKEPQVKLVKRFASVVSNRYEACLLILSKVTAQHLAIRKTIPLHSGTLLEVGQSQSQIDIEDSSDSKPRSGYFYNDLHDKVRLAHLKSTKIIGLFVLIKSKNGGETRLETSSVENLQELMNYIKKFIKLASNVWN